MNSNAKKLFTTTHNFALLRERLGDYKRLPTEKEVREFLEFLDDVSTIWKEMNLAIDYKSIEEKAKARREFVLKLGIRST